MTSWGQIQNNIGYGTIYNQTWVGEYIFLTVVGDGNDFAKRVSDDSGTMEAHTTLVGNLNYSLK